MMTSEKQEELNESVDLLMRHQLWRRGKTDKMRVTVSEIGDAIDCVCGGVLDYLELQKDFDRVVQQRDAMMETVKQAVADSRELACVKAERNHLKAILAGLRIPHKMKKKR